MYTVTSAPGARPVTVGEAQSAEIVMNEAGTVHDPFAVATATTTSDVRDPDFNVAMPSVREEPITTPEALTLALVTAPEALTLALVTAPDALLLEAQRQPLEVTLEAFNNPPLRFAVQSLKLPQVY